MSNRSFSCDYLRDAIVQWRHDFHRHPELGFEEHRTSQIVARLLEEFGIEVHREVGGTGIVGVLRRGNSPKSIGLRADLDALAITEENTFDHRSRYDGKMHACGHDGHTAMLLGAARHLAESGVFDGTVFLIFQPAEEHGKGALSMIEDGLFQRFPADAIYAMHNFPSLPVGSFAVRPGPIMACEDNFEIRIDGKGTHAALPHRGIDPILIGSEIVMALQSLVSRTIDPVDNAVVSVTEFLTDGTRNVLPGRVTLRGDTRSFGSTMQNHIEATMERIVSGICAAHGASHGFRYSREFAATINSPAEAEIVATVALRVVGAENINGGCAPIMASEDFGFMLQHKPGCYLLIGNGGEGPGGCGLHSPSYDFNDDILTIGANFWVQLVESQLSGEEH
jgi:amidohydrolase